MKKSILILAIGIGFVFYACKKEDLKQSPNITNTPSSSATSNNQNRSSVVVSASLATAISNSANESANVTIALANIKETATTADYTTFISDFKKTNGDSASLDTLFNNKYTGSSYKNLQQTMQVSTATMALLMNEFKAQNVVPLQAMLNIYREDYIVFYKTKIKGGGSQRIPNGVHCALIYVVESALCTGTGPLLALCLAYTTYSYADCLDSAK